MKRKKPVLLISGASGIVGRHFIKRIQDDFKVYAFSRRVQNEAWIPMHQNVTWLKVDIANFLPLKTLFHDILAKEKEVDLILHLAL